MTQPRTWTLPDRPSPGTKVVDRFGVVWSRRRTDPIWADLWYAGGMNAHDESGDHTGHAIQRWSALLERGTLTEVVENGTAGIKVKP